MSTYYIPSSLDDYVKENGGRDFLVRLIRQHQGGDVRDVPRSDVPHVPANCPHCGIRIERLGPCWHCGKLVQDNFSYKWPFR